MGSQIDNGILAKNIRKIDFCNLIKEELKLTDDDIIRISKDTKSLKIYKKTNIKIGFDDWKYSYKGEEYSQCAHTDMYLQESRFDRIIQDLKTHSKTGKYNLAELTFYFNGSNGRKSTVIKKSEEFIELLSKEYDVNVNEFYFILKICGCKKETLIQSISFPKK